MTVLVFLAVLTALLWFVALPLFEGVVTLALVIPLAALLIARLGQFVGVDWAGDFAQAYLYSASILLAVSTAYAVFGLRRQKRCRTECYGLVVLGVIYSAAFYLCSQKWPDFIPLGERLRDYSLIVSAIHSPIEARELWMEGTPLNYYVFWYRFAAMLHAVCGLAVWNTYHAVVALAVALYGAVCFQIVRVIFAGGMVSAIIAAVLIPFGSNVMGILRVTRTEGGGWGHDVFWWGPSRVIRGAITEFPGWSFVLGDAHPHYLNLVTIPFLFLLFIRCVARQTDPLVSVIQGAFVILAGVMFLFGANAWDVPMWLGLCLVVVLIRFHSEAAPTVVRFIGGCSKQQRLAVVQAIGVLVIVSAALLLSVRGYSPDRLRAFSLLLLFIALFTWRFFPRAAVRDFVCPYLRPISVPRILPQVVMWCVLFLALYFNSHHIAPEAGVLERVQEPIAVTTSKEFLYHWGFHASMLLMGVLFIAPFTLSAVFLSLFVVGSLFFDKAGGFILLLLGAYLLRALVGTPPGRKESFVEVCTDALVVAGLGLVMIPEVVFLNDAYGGENERMNTIFKIYTTAWGLIGLGVVAVALRIWRASARLSVPYRYLQRVSIVALSLFYAIGTFYPVESAAYGFYGNVIPKRLMQTSQYGAEGLGQLDRDKPGAAAIIRLLRDSPRGRVIEAQGNPYSYTTFVSTLSAQPSYVGWLNHLQLLSRVPEEVERRSGITARFFGRMSCSDRLEIARSERIRYVVFGSNERQQYPELREADFGCFTKRAQEGEYLLFETRDTEMR